MEDQILQLRKKRRRRKQVKIFLGILSCILTVAVCVILVRYLGKKRLMNQADSKTADMESEKELTSEEAEEGIVYYRGERYRYNDQIITILCMGIDSGDSLTEAGEMGKAGQSDSNFLVVLNTKAKTMELIGISRDTMTDIAIYDENGEYLRTVEEHLAIQFAYGDGSTVSCELMETAVSSLMYGLPIHGYCAINLDGIAVLNDAVGGVELEVLQDLTVEDPALKKGATVKLTGKQAHAYVRYRGKVFAGNNQRVERQKQYLSAYADTLKEQTKKDLTIPLKICQKMTDYMITDISLDQITYLAAELLDYEFDLGHVRSIRGEVIQPENSRYEQFHVDYDALYELILEVFYEKLPEEKETSD